MYKCIIWSDSSKEREYDVDTKSAMKCAELHGRCEGGETVTVFSPSGRPISQVRWTPEDGGKYYRATL